MSSGARISLIHATPVAIEPITESFRRLWPDATTCNLLDESLTADLDRAGGDIMSLAPRFSALLRYSLDTGADGILFTCSSFGLAVESARTGIDIPVLKPNEAMIEEALEIGRKILLVATFKPALAPIMREFDELASSRGAAIAVTPIFVDGALDALKGGDRQTHDQLIAQACADGSGDDVICFAQFSMTSAHAAAELTSRRPTLTTTDSAVKRLKALLGQS